jgi:hypothetical protein
MISRPSHVNRVLSRKASLLTLQQHSLVNIAPELRNKIYAQLLLIGGPVILAPQKRTIVPGLVLLRTCRQIHDEAASFFYEVNSFQCYILKLIPVQCASEGSIQCPNLTSFISPTTFLDPLAIHGGIFFSAQRYHQYLTRLTIGVKASFRTFDMTTSSRQLLRLPSGNLDTTRANVGKTQQAMQQEVHGIYQDIGRSWSRKDDNWSGRVVMPARSTAMTELVYWIEFEVGGEEEAKKKGERSRTRQRGTDTHMREELFLLKGMWTSWILRLSDDRHVRQYHRLSYLTGSCRSSTKQTDCEVL